MKGTAMKKNKRLTPLPRKIVIDYSEKWGKDVEEAVRLALADLKLTREEVEVTVLEEPVRGFLGIGAKLAKVRVEKIRKPEFQHEETGVVKESSIAEKTHNQKIRDIDFDNCEELIQEHPKQKSAVRDLRKKKKSNENDTTVVNTKLDKRSEPERTRGSGRSGTSPLKNKRGPGNEAGYEKHADDRQDKRSERRHDKHDRHADNRKESYVEHKEDSTFRKGDRLDSHIKDSKFTERNNDTVIERYNREENFTISRKPTNLTPASPTNEADRFFRELIDKMLLDIKITSYENDVCVYLEVEGRDSRTIIGKRGLTLDAIQYLTNLVMNKNRDDYKRVIVDVEGYRSRRERTLENLAIKLSGKVEKTGRSVRLEPMNPYERKVIHATLQSNPRINTRSEGEEPYRRVIIERK
jgi:spoIIIJ-associated protein